MLILLDGPIGVSTFASFVVLRLAAAGSCECFALAVTLCVGVVGFLFLC